MSFWTVSDDHPFILGLDAKGAVISAIPLGKGGRDLEGLIEDTARARLLAVSENKTEITSIDLNDLSKITRHPLSAMDGFSELPSDVGADWRKNGLEGITVAPETGIVYVVKEREPRMMIAISADLSTILSVEMLGRDAGLISPRKKDRSLDISGIAMDPPRDGQWILSDTDQAVFFRNLQDGSVHRYPLSWMSGGDLQPVSNPEGVALSADGKQLFVITDDGKNSALFQYDVQ
ncbi:MAG: SdiA-regulated domain-containing protein [Marinosulfonomonas sp.]